MVQVRDFLDRFRPAGAPGAAAKAGVPPDRTREQSAELDPVLALLDDTHAECQRLVAAARQEAARIAADGEAQAAAIRADGARRADAARQQALREVLRQASAQAQAPVAASRREAAEIRRRSRERIPELAARAVARILAAEGPA